MLTQNGAIKQQVDMLRRLMCDVQVMGGLEVELEANGEAPQAEARPG